MKACKYCGQLLNLGARGSESEVHNPNSGLGFAGSLQQKQPDLRFVKNLNFWRRNRKRSLKSVAHQLGVAVSTWSQWESGKRSPSVSWLPLIAQALQISQCALISNNPSDCKECLRHL